jgi:PAS domain S-box-containing protein
VLALGLVAGAGWLFARVLRRQVEERTQELLETDAKLRATLVAAPNVGFLVAEDPTDEARVLELSEGAARMLGHTRETARDLRMGGLRSPADAERYGNLLGTRRAAGGRAREAELVRASGESFPAFVVSSILPREEDERARLLYVLIDLSDRERAEREKRELERHLQQAQKMEALGRLAGGVAHDFKNVLTTILGNAELARQAAGGDALRQSLDEIVQASEAATRIVDQLLTFSRHKPGASRRTTWNEVLSEVEPVLRRLVAPPARLVVERAEAPFAIEVDPGQAAQVVLNLAVNARDALEGEGTVAIRTHNEARAGHAWAVLCVRDDGRGMDEETRARIFEPFFSTKPEGAGVGLGLATVYGIVEQAGGDVEVSSQPGKGTEFRVALPRAPD